MIRIRDISLLPGQGQPQLLQKVSKILRLNMGEISSLHIRKRSVDARKKNDIRIVYTVDVTVSPKRKPYILPKDSKISQAPTDYYKIPRCSNCPAQRPVIVGFGPAGMFAGLVLARAGLKPLIIERGQDVDTRTAKVNEFWRSGTLDTECNVQFGEGGAGTFSDGKLNTGVNDIRIAWVLDELAKHGANDDILYDAKPHVGTDVLAQVVKSIRNEILSLGGEIRFGTKLTALREENGCLAEVTVVSPDGTEHIACDRLILAIGHSARDTFQVLLEQGIRMEPKPFSMGVRIEHPQCMVDKSQYGDFSGNPYLPAADYKLNVRTESGSAYTFCMCPGGYVVAAASEEGGVVTNGMSNHARDGENANAALLVTLNPEDFPYEGALGGMLWQRELEQTAYRAGGSNYKAPAQTVGSFLKTSNEASDLSPTYKPGVTYCDLHEVLPEKITKVLEEALPELGRKLSGFDSPDAILTAPETRSSSPVRIVRNENKQSSLLGLYPCGEGAGYAGGITSAAVDGIVCAEAVIASY